MLLKSVGRGGVGPGSREDRGACEPPCEGSETPPVPQLGSSSSSDQSEELSSLH